MNSVYSSSPLFAEFVCSLMLMRQLQYVNRYNYPSNNIMKLIQTFCLHCACNSRYIAVTSTWLLIIAQRPTGRKVIFIDLLRWHCQYNFTVFNSELLMNCWDVTSVHSLLSTCHAWLNIEILYTLAVFSHVTTALILQRRGATSNVTTGYLCHKD